MTIGVGLAVDDAVSTAVVTAPGSDVRTIEHPTILSTAPDGTVQLGDPAPESTGVVRDFLRHVGEPSGIEYGTSPTRAEDLLATAMFCLFREAAHGLSEPIAVTATHPSGWDPDRVRLLRESLDYMGLNEAALVAESVARAVSGTSAAHGAALLAAGLALTDEDTHADTQPIPVVPPPVHTAYSAVPEPPTPALDVDPEAIPESTSSPSPSPVTIPAKPAGRRSLFLAGSAAAALVAGSVLAFIYTNEGRTAIPTTIQDAQTEPVTSSTSPSSPSSTGSITPPPVSRQEAAVTTTEVAPRPLAPPPPPPPRSTGAPFVPEPPIPVVTSTPATTEAETTTPTSTTTTESSTSTTRSSDVTTSTRPTTSATRTTRSTGTTTITTSVGNSR